MLSSCGSGRLRSDAPHEPQPPVFNPKSYKMEDQTRIDFYR
jgi:hypothetical protein